MAIVHAILRCLGFAYSSLVRLHSSSRKPKRQRKATQPVCLLTGVVGRSVWLRYSPDILDGRDAPLAERLLELRQPLCIFRYVQIRLDTLRSVHFQIRSVVFRYDQIRLDTRFQIRTRFVIFRYDWIRDGISLGIRVAYLNMRFLDTEGALEANCVRRALKCLCFQIRVSKKN